MPDERPSTRHRWYMPIKAAIEFVLAVLMSILTTPVLLLAALLIKLTSQGPVIMRQTRVGRDGKTYTIFKLRTMQHNCEALTGPKWATPGDPRVTPFGRFLRVTHIDELPEIWNVLRGEMNLIGPRPERPEFVQQFEKAIPNYLDRLAVRPGITGLAQVNLPPASDVASVRRKLAHDLYYLYQANPWLDLRILICTAFSSMGLPFWCLRPMHRALHMPTSEMIEDTYEHLISGRTESYSAESIVAPKRSLRNLLPRAPGFPRFWELLGYVLPKKTRERVFTPTYQELLEDYVSVRRKYRTKWARRWLNFCFTFRTLLMIGDCFRAMMADKAFQLLLRLVPEPIKKWWVP